MDGKINKLYVKIIRLYEEKYEKDSPIFADLYKEYKKKFPNYGITRITFIIFQELRKRNVIITPNYIYMAVVIGLHNRIHAKYLIKVFGISKAEQMITKIRNVKDIDSFIKKFGKEKLLKLKVDDIKRLTSVYKYSLPYKWKYKSSLSQELQKQVKIMNKYLLSINLEDKTMEGVTSLESTLIEFRNMIDKKLEEIQHFKNKKIISIEVNENERRI